MGEGILLAIYVCVYIDLRREPLTRTEDIIGRRKEHFEDFLNLASMSSIEETESGDLGEDLYIILAEVARLVKKLPVVKALG